MVVFFGCAFSSLAIAPVQAGEPAACDAASARLLIVAGDRFDARRRYVDATRSYLAASRSTRDCRAAAEVLINSRALAKAGSALAQRGEYLKALSLLGTAQARLTPVAVGDAQPASAARDLAEQVQNLIAAIDDVARSTL